MVALKRRELALPLSRFAVVGPFRVHGYGLVLEDKCPTYGPKGRRAMEGVSAVTPIVSEINL